MINTGNVILYNIIHIIHRVLTPTDIGRRSAVYAYIAVSSSIPCILYVYRHIITVIEHCGTYIVQNVVVEIYYILVIISFSNENRDNQR